jgi:hypothetical protein
MGLISQAAWRFLGHLGKGQKENQGRVFNHLVKYEPSAEFSLAGRGELLSR